MKLQIAPEIQIIEEQKEETELEPLYRVLIHNDHITPMDFVVQILTTVFYLPNDKAIDIMTLPVLHMYKPFPNRRRRSASTRRILPQDWRDIRCISQWSLKSKGNLFMQWFKSF
jgi:ATP-dependent Clp protease adaptor protein ClpS